MRTIVPRDHRPARHPRPVIRLNEDGPAERLKCGPELQFIDTTEPPRRMSERAVRGVDAGRTANRTSSAGAGP